MAYQNDNFLEENAVHEVASRNSSSWCRIPNNNFRQHLIRELGLAVPLEGEWALGLGFLGFRVFMGRREEREKSRNAELGAMVVQRRRWREGIVKGREGERKGEGEKE